MAKSPFDLHMHEEMELITRLSDPDNDSHVTGERCVRVPGGWIYTLAISDGSGTNMPDGYQCVFVSWSERVETECVSREQMLSVDK